MPLQRQGLRSLLGTSSANSCQAEDLESAPGSVAPEGVTIPWLLPGCSQRHPRRSQPPRGMKAALATARRAAGDSRRRLRKGQAATSARSQGGAARAVPAILCSTPPQISHDPPAWLSCELRLCSPRFGMQRTELAPPAATSLHRARHPHTRRRSRPVHFSLERRHPGTQTGSRRAPGALGTELEGALRRMAASRRGGDAADATGAEKQDPRHLRQPPFRSRDSRAPKGLGKQNLSTA
eukprot:scaffold293_cov248-Pinguiococcus_pyrenoidosus.AAC.11